MLGQVKLEVFIASLAEDLLALDDLGCEAVTVAHTGRASARLYKLWCDSHQAQVALLSDGIGFEHLQEFVQCSLRQSFNVVIASKYRSVSLT